MDVSELWSLHAMNSLLTVFSIKMFLITLQKISQNWTVEDQTTKLQTLIYQKKVIMKVYLYIFLLVTL